MLASLVFSITAFDYGPLRFAARIWRPLLAAGLMYGVVVMFGEAVSGWWPGLPDVMRLAAMVAVGGIVYPAALLLIWAVCGLPAGAERTTLDLLRRLLQRRKPRGEDAAVS